VEEKELLGLLRPVACGSLEELTQVKQYLVIKLVESFDKVASLMALPGLYTLEAAQQLVTQAVTSEPGASFVIQEVGAA
jgi:hypothetical protein